MLKGEKMKKKILTSTLFGCYLILMETIIIKAVQYKILPGKYFYDSGHILAVMNGSNWTDIGYTFTANFFNRINIFGFTTIQEWSYLLAAIFSILLVVVLMKYRKFSLVQYIYIFASVGLLNIYVFNLSKDIIQFLFFFAIYLILTTKIGNVKKLLLCCLILIYEAINFRVYYLIMAMLMITIYWIYIFLIKDRTMTRESVVKIIILALIAFFIEVYFVQMFSEENYESIILARYNVNVWREYDIDAVTIINDPFGKSTNYRIFIQNYLVNTLRMMIPIELFAKGVKYIPFIIYQIFVTYNIFKMSSKINDNNIMWLITVISFMMVSIIFEPDFGSFIRHESALILLLLQINVFNNQRFAGKRNKEEYE